MVAITQEDAAWAFGYNPYAGTVHQQWVGNVKPGPLVNDRLMYMKVDPALRATKIAAMEQPDLVADRCHRAGADGGRCSRISDVETARARECGARAAAGTDTAGPSSWALTSFAAACMRC